MDKLKRHKEKIIGIVVSIIFIILILWKLDFQRLIETFKIFDYKILFVFVPLYVLSLYIRGIRWKYLLCETSKLTINEAFFAFTTGNTLNSYLPARAGDFWRAYHIGGNLNESRMKMLGSIILERIIDGISILLILIFAALTYFKHDWVINITYSAAALFLGSLLFFYILFKTNKISCIFHKLSQIKYLEPHKDKLLKAEELSNKFLEGFQALNNPKCFFIAFLTSCIAWAIECILTYFLICAFGFHFGISIAFFVLSFLALSTIIPSSSIFVGPYQYAYILALGIYHIDKSRALGIAFVHQIIIMLTITVISVIYFTLTDTSLKNIKNELKQEQDDTNNE